MLAGWWRASRAGHTVVVADHCLVLPTCTQADGNFLRVWFLTCSAVWWIIPLLLRKLRDFLANRFVSISNLTELPKFHTDKS